MKRHWPISDYFISKQTRNTSPANDYSASPSDDAVHLDATSNPIDLPQLSSKSLLFLHPAPLKPAAGILQNKINL